MRIILVHGWQDAPESNWFPWLKSKLEEKGHEVLVPQMPNTDMPEINAWVSHLRETVGKLDEETFFVGHSIGCQAILRYLAFVSQKVKIGGIILVAPWTKLKPIVKEEEGAEEIARPWVTIPIDWNTIKSRVDKTVAIFSSNDYYVFLDEKHLFEDKLDAQTFIEIGKGHFASSDGIKELPIVLEKLEEMFEK
jgi:predicted alpha/beta hydrolase family esterase